MEAETTTDARDTVDREELERKAREIEAYEQHIQNAAEGVVIQQFKKTAKFKRAVSRTVQFIKNNQTALETSITDFLNEP